MLMKRMPGEAVKQKQEEDRWKQVEVEREQQKG
jgi:hypothetical protein